MKRVTLCVVMALALVACRKDKFKSEPQVEIKSLGPDVVQKGQLFTLRAEVTDKEGDLQDSVLLVRKRFAGNVQLTVDTLRYNLFDFNFPDKQTIEVSAIFSYGELIDGAIFANLESQDRQFAVGMIVRDKAGNRSNYAESNKITLKRL